MWNSIFCYFYYIILLNIFRVFYLFYCYAVVYKNESFEMIKNLKADKFIEDFLKEFSEPFENTTFIFV